MEKKTYDQLLSKLTNKYLDSKIDKATYNEMKRSIEMDYERSRLTAFSKNVRNELKKRKKIYFYDVGTRNAIINNFNDTGLRTDIGQLWENFLISERYKFLNNSNIDFQHFFWRTTQQQEIDYIEKTDTKLIAFEFKWNPNKKVKFSKVFTNAYPESQTHIISKNNYAFFLSNRMEDI